MKIKHICDFHHFDIVIVKIFFVSSEPWPTMCELKNILFDLVYAFTPKTAIERVEETHIRPDLVDGRSGEHTR